ncbi:MAG TPA: peptidylprolyl isomerase [Candidatus Eremiobacteraceae bacterium]|nr:peptidylprolyl isomerase [Candidatus Eremiobacteraceae bacterium]
MKYRFATLALAAAGIAVSLLASACSAEDKTLVSADNYKVSKGELDAKLEKQPVAGQVLRSMVEQDLIFQYAKDNNITVTDAEIDSKIADIKARLSDAQLAQALQQQGMTEQDLRDILHQQLIIKKAVDATIHVSDKQLSDYLAQNHTLLDQQAQVRARHILVSTQATAEMIEGKLKAGGDFAKLAAQYSTDPGTKDKGGELGFFTRTAMVKEFSDAAFSMKVGQVSAPVHSPYGWHIIQVEEIKPAMVATVANSRQKILDNMLAAQEQAQYPAFMDKIMQGAKITVEDPQYADTFPSPQPAPAASAPQPSGK